MKGDIMHDPLIAAVIWPHTHRRPSLLNDPLDAPEWDGLDWLITLFVAWHRWRNQHKGECGHQTKCADPGKVRHAP